MVDQINNLDSSLPIALVVGSPESKDAYLSITEALKHAGLYLNTGVDFVWVDPSGEQITETLCRSQGILVAGDFDQSDQEGILSIIRYARENQIPFLGIHSGFYFAINEAAKETTGVQANAQPPNNQHKRTRGSRLLTNSQIFESYQQEIIQERYRHDFDIDLDLFVKKLQKPGLIASGISLDGKKVTVVELKEHPWFLAAQFHPEFKSRPRRPHPLFVSFLMAAQKYCLQARSP